MPPFAGCKLLYRRDISTHARAITLDVQMLREPAGTSSGLAERLVKDLTVLKGFSSYYSVASIKEAYLRLKFNTSRVLRAMVRAGCAGARDMSNGGGCAIIALHTSLCGLIHGGAW